MNPDQELITLRQLEPVFLLVNLYNGFDRALRFHCGPKRDTYRRRGDDIAYAQCANCERQIGGGQYPLWTNVPAIEGHATTEWHRKRLAAHGIRTEFHDYAEPGLSFRALDVETNVRNLRTVRTLAKEDLCILSNAASDEFDRRFNLYFNQRYAYDWASYAAHFEKAHWPVPADGWLSLKEDFDLFQANEL